MMEKVKVFLKNGKVIEVLPKEVAGLKKAGLVAPKRKSNPVKKQEKKTGNTKEQKDPGDTKEITGQVKA